MRAQNTDKPRIINLPSYLSSVLLKRSSDSYKPTIRYSSQDDPEKSKFIQMVLSGHRRRPLVEPKGIYRAIHDGRVLTIRVTSIRNGMVCGYTSLLNRYVEVPLSSIVGRVQWR